MVIILVALTILVAVSVRAFLDYLARKREVTRVETERDYGTVSPALALAVHGRVPQFPEDVYYHNGHAWMRIEDTSLRVCVALPILAMPRATPTSVGHPYVGSQSPHVSYFLTRRKNGHLHAWKAGFSGSGWDYGRRSHIDAGHGPLHIVEDPGKRRALFPAPGRKSAVFAHDQHPFRKAAFPTSHAGTREIFLSERFRRSMGAPEISSNRSCFDGFQVSNE